MKYLILGAISCGVLLGAAVGAVAGETPTACSLLGMEDPTNSPVRVSAVLKSAGAEAGITCRVEIENLSDEAVTLMVCPDMRPCCVKGLHSLVSQDGIGAGLLDICDSPEPQSHPVYLPPTGAFSVDVTIPADRLPAFAKLGRDPMQVLFCQEIGDGRLVHSNVLEVSLD